MSELNKSHASLLKGPLQVQFDITNKCNFRCLHCYNNSGENFACDNELSDLEIIKLFRELKDLKPYNICFCGGEPLLRFDLIIKVSKLIKKSVSSISLVTNGFLLTEQNLLRLIDAGVNRIQISLDGNTKESHEFLRRKDMAFEKALEAIKICTKYKSELKETMVCFSPTAFNIKEFHSVANRVFSMGVNVLRVQPLMLSGRATKYEKLIKPEYYQYQQLKKTINFLNTAYETNRIEWGDPVDHIIRFRKYLADIYTNVTIQANGDIVATPYIPISFGNIRNHTLTEYWNAGLPFIWNNAVLQQYAYQINTLSDIGKNIEGFPKLWEEGNLVLDLFGEKK